jgi:hypothetical protein
MAERQNEARKLRRILRAKKKDINNVTITPALLDERKRETDRQTAFAWDS